MCLSSPVRKEVVVLQKVVAQGATAGRVVVFEGVYGSAKRTFLSDEVGEQWL